MASKKCPKCGEDNPAEAVMCWACYTPLTGSAPLGAGLAGAAAVGTLPNAAAKPIGVPPGAEEASKKGIDPKTIAIGAFLVVGVLAALFMNGALGGGSSEEITTGEDPIAGQTDMVQSSPGAPPTTTASIPQMQTNTNTGGAAPAPVPLPFTTITPPNPKFDTGTMGILVANNVSPQQAAGFARFARDQISRNGKWSKMQISVFTDKTAATAFASYQRKRRGAPLTNADFQQLASVNVWSGAPTFLESRGKQEKIYAPSQSPTAWWQRR